MGDERCCEDRIVAEDGLTLAMLAALVGRLRGEAVSGCLQMHISSDNCDCGNPDEIRALPAALLEKLDGCDSMSTND